MSKMLFISLKKSPIPLKHLSYDTGIEMSSSKNFAADSVNYILLELFLDDKTLST